MRAPGNLPNLFASQPAENRVPTVLFTVPFTMSNYPSKSYPIQVETNLQFYLDQGNNDGIFNKNIWNHCTSLQFLTTYCTYMNFTLKSQYMYKKMYDAVTFLSKPCL